MEKTDNDKRKVSILPVLRLFWKASSGDLVLGMITFGAAIASYILQLVTPIYYKRFFDTLAGSGGNATPDAVHVLILTIGSIAVINGVLWVLWRLHEFVSGVFHARAMKRMVNTAFGNLIYHSYSFFTSSFTGSLVRKVTRLPRSFEQFSDILLYNILSVVIVLAGVPFILGSRNPLLGIGFFAFAIILIGFHIFIANWKQQYNISATEKDSAVTAVISDSISNEHTVKLFAGEEREIAFVGEASEAHRKARLLSWNISGVINAIQAAFMFVTEIGLLYIMVRLWEKGVVTIGDFALVQAYLISAMGQLWGFNRSIRGIYEALADATEMVDIMETPYEVRDTVNTTELKVTKADIAFKDVTFAFNQTRTILDAFNLEIKGGERVALVGPSGAGKSTILKLLLRLHDVTDGKIKIDGQNIKDVTQASLRSAIGFVPQEPILFHRTLLDNIRYGSPDATEAEVIEAAKGAHCHEFISEFPEGYQTFVGERGVKLSGGERQRVAIARAILKNAPILILDEATSSLDSESEHLIQEALQNLMKGKTVVVIAHRLSTIMSMDRIVVIEDGKVVDDGTHKSLLKKDGLYKKLWNIQAGGFLVEEPENDAVLPVEEEEAIASEE